MNVLYLHAHDAGRWISPYGHEDVRTPNLQKLADHSTLFLNAHSAAPTCSPSRAALLTGMTPHQTGMLGLAHRGFHLNDPSKHLASYLKRQGFETALAGIQHLFHGTDPIPYDHQFKGRKGGGWLTADHSVARQAADFLHEPHDRPFFLDCGFWYPHRPFPAPAPQYDLDSLSLPRPLIDTPEVRQDFASFLTAVEFMDGCCGMVLDALEASGHAEDTLVLFTVDHGPPFPGMKCNLNDAGTGVALMMRYPGNPTAGEKCTSLVSHLDLYPTICDLLDLQPPPWLQGVSLRSLLEDTASQVRDEVYSEVTFHAAYEPQRSIRTHTHRLTVILDNDLSPVPANVDDSPAKTALIEKGWLERKRNSMLFYDLMSPEGERLNRAADPAYLEPRQALEKRLLRWMRHTEDPLLTGAVPPPEGAYVNERSHLSPTEGEPGGV